LQCDCIIRQGNSQRRPLFLSGKSDPVTFTVRNTHLSFYSERLTSSIEREGKERERERERGEMVSTNNPPSRDLLLPLLDWLGRRTYRMKERIQWGARKQKGIVVERLVMNFRTAKGGGAPRVGRKSVVSAVRTNTSSFCYTGS